MARAFSSYKDFRGEFPRFFGKKFDDSFIFWNLVRKASLDFGTFGYDLWQIPVVLNNIDFTEINKLVQSTNNDSDNEARMRFQYIILLFINK